MKMRLWMTVGGLCLCLLVLAVLLAKPAYRWAQGWRAEALIKEAHVLVEREQYDEAFQKALSGHYLNTRNTQIALELARVALAKKDANVWRWWRDVIDHPDRTPEELAELVKLLRSQGQYDIVRQLLPRALEENPSNPELTLARIDLLQRDRRQSEVESLARGISASDSDSMGVHSVYIQSLLTSDNPEEGQRAIEHLGELAERDNELGLAALRSLVVLPAVGEEGRLKHVAQLKQHPLATATDKLLAFAVDLELGQGSFDELWASLLKEFDMEKSENIAILSSWLLRQRQWDRVLDLVPPEVAQTDSQLQLIRLTALLRMERSAEVYEATLRTGPDNPLKSTINLVVRSRALEAMDRKKEANEVLALAAETAELSDYPVLEQELFRTENWDILVALYERALNNSRTRNLGLERLMRAYYYLGAEDKLRSTLSQVDMEEFRNDPAALNFVAYLHFLFGSEMMESRNEVEELLARYPTVSDFQLSTAFFYLLVGQQQKAGALAGNYSDFPTEAPRYLKIMAASLLTTRPDGGGELFNRLNWELATENLLFSEQQLLDNVKSSIAAKAPEEGVASGM